MAIRLPNWNLSMIDYSKRINVWDSQSKISLSTRMTAESLNFQTKVESKSPNLTCRLSLFRERHSQVKLRKKEIQIVRMKAIMQRVVMDLKELTLKRMKMEIQTQVPKKPNLNSKKENSKRRCLLLKNNDGCFILIYVKQNILKNGL